MKLKSPITVFAPSKINLSLDILNRDSSGYHEIDTVFYELKSPCDQVIIEGRDDNEIEIKCDDPKVPTGEKNLVWKILRELGLNGLTITIKKKIPVAGGLGGGSSDAIAVLKALHHALGLKLTQGRRLQVAKNIGADAAFFLHRYCARGRHFGEELEGLPYVELPVNIFETGISISSEEAYESIDLLKCGKDRKKTETLVFAIKRKNANGIIENMHNDFDEWAFSKYPKLLEIKNRLQKDGARKVMLAGSGGALIVCHSESSEAPTGQRRRGI